jgi:predicted TIM-barrel fold metal-dependent hydrolase
VNETLIFSAAQGYCRSVTWALEAGADFGYKDEVMEKIMHGNAERVLGL